MHPFLETTGPIAFAHRGGASAAPENTLAAFADAVSLGYTYVETDVHATADGVLVAFHDDDLSRTCSTPGRIAQLPWSTVSQARVSGTEQIPLLEDILGSWPTLRVNIDCKTDSALEPLIATIRRTNSIERVCLGSFSDSRLKSFELRSDLISAHHLDHLASLEWSGHHSHIESLPNRMAHALHRCQLLNRSYLL